MKLIAKSNIGEEYIYSRSSAHAVSNAGAEIICKALNDRKYKLKPGEVWAVHDCGNYELDYTAAGYQKFTHRKGVIREVRY